MKLTKDYFIEGKIIKAGTELEIVTEAKKSVDKKTEKVKTRVKTKKVKEEKVKRELTESVESFLRPLEKEVKSYRNRDYSDYIIGVATDSVISLIEDYDVYFDDEDNPSIVYIKQDYLFEIVDNNTDIYNGDLIKWLQDDDNAVYDVEDYLEKYGYNKEGFFRMLMGAQSNIIERAIYSVLEDIDGIEIR